MKKTIIVNTPEKLQDYFDSLKISKLQYIYYRLIEIPKLLKKIFYDNIVCFIQRGIRGYSYRDVWNTDYYLSDIIVNMLKELKKTSDMPEEIDKMIYTFETNKQIINYDGGTIDKKYNEGWKLFQKNFLKLWY